MHSFHIRHISAITSGHQACQTILGSEQNVMGTILFLNFHVLLYFLMTRILEDYVCFEEPLFIDPHFKVSTTNTTLSYWYIYQHLTITTNYIHPLGPYSLQSIGAAAAGSWAIGHNPGRVATPTQDTQIAQSFQQAGTHFADLGKMTGWINPISL